MSWQQWLTNDAMNRASAEQRCADARQKVQGNDKVASRGLAGRVQGARAIYRGERGGNPGSRKFGEMADDWALGIE